MPPNGDMVGDGYDAHGFGDLVRAHRRRAGMTQEQLAAGSGLSIRTIANIERGQVHRPHPQTVRMLLEALRRHEEKQEPGPSVPAPVHSVPRQLPHRQRHFVGRTTEYTMLRAMVTDRGGADASVALISGPAGMGKSALALHLAHDVAAEYRDGQLYLDLRGFDRYGSRVSGEEALARLLRGLGVEPHQIPCSTDERASLYRSAVAGRRMLLVVDNVRTTRQLRPLLPGDPGCLVLATSRKVLGGLLTTDGAAHLPLGPLTTHQAQELLVRIVSPHRTLPAREAARLARACGNLPLALHNAAANLIMGTGPGQSAGGFRSNVDLDRTEQPEVGRPGYARTPTSAKSSRACRSQDRAATGRSTRR